MLQRRVVISYMTNTIVICIYNVIIYQYQYMILFELLSKSNIFSVEYRHLRNNFDVKYFSNSI